MLDTRVVVLEEKVRRLHDEVEACSVLVLQLDATAAARGGGGASPRSGGGWDEDEGIGEARAAEVGRLRARIEVLEEAHALRNEVTSQVRQEGLVRLEGDIKEVWRVLRGLERRDRSAKDPAPQAPEAPQDVVLLRGELEVLRQEFAALRSPAAGSARLQGPPVNRQELDEVLENMAAEFGKGTTRLEERLHRLEDSYARVEAIEVAAKAGQHRAGELERSVELLVQQRREDLLATNSQLRDVESRFRRLGDDGSWAEEADALRAEIEDMRLEKIPSVFQHSTRTAQVIAEGLQALRKELIALSDRVDHGGSGGAGGGGGEGGSRAYGNDWEVAAELTNLKAETQELRQFLTGHLEGGLEAQLLAVRADVAAELEQSLRKGKENWADASRRLAALEPWKDEHVALHAEVRALRLERQEDRARLGHLVRDELAALRTEIDSHIADAQTQALRRFEREAATVLAALPPPAPPAPTPAPEPLAPAPPLPVAPRPEPLAPAPPLPGAPRLVEEDALLPLRGEIEALWQELAALRSLVAGSARRHSVDQHELDEPPSLPAPQPPSLPAPQLPELPPLPPVVVVGHRAEWPLSAAVLASFRQYGGGLLVSAEFHVEGVLGRLKFFPDGSPRRVEAGFCSLYLMAGVAARLRFKLFAGPYETPTLTCDYDPRRDHGRLRDLGRNDLCRLDAVLDDSGGTVVGAELISIQPFELRSGEGPVATTRGAARATNDRNVF